MQTKPQSSLILLTSTAILLCIGALIPTANAADGTWTGGTTNTWATNSNWLNDIVPGSALTNADIATFNSATYLFQPTAANSYFLGGLVFGSANGGTTITTGTANNRLNIGSSGIQMSSGSGAVFLGTTNSAQGVNITANQTWSNDSSSLLNISRVSVDDAASAGTYTISITGSGSGGVAVSNNLADVNNAGDSTRKLATVINVSGTGATSFSGSSTYSGGTTLTAGLLQIGANAALGTGTVALNGGRFSSTATSSQSPGNSVTIGGNVALGDAVNSGKLTFNGAIDLGGATRTLTVDSDVVFSNVVSNGGITLTKTGTNKPIMTLSGTNANTYNGTTTVNDGTLYLSKTGGANAIAGGLTIGDGTGDDTVRLLSSDQIADTIAVNLVGTNANNRGILELFTFSDTIGGLSGSGIVQNGTTNTNSASVLTLNVADATTKTSSAVLRNSGTATAGSLSIVKMGAGTQILTGAMNYTGDTTISAGTLQLGDGTLTNDGNLTIPNIINNASLVFNRVGANNSYGGVISGTGNLTKSGAGAQILSGINTYNGTTTVNGGTLQVNGSISTNTLSVSNGATLAGLGTIGGDVAVSGNLQPGHGATNGVLTIGGSLTVASNGIVNLSIDSLAEYDRLAGASSYTVGGTINVAASTNYSPTNGNIFHLFSGAIGGTPTVNVTPLSNTNYVWVTNDFISTGKISVASVAPVLTPYGSWLTNYPGITNFPGGTSNTNGNADPDDDGFDNNMEFAFDGDPTVGSPAMISAASSGSGSVFSFLASTNTNAVTYVVQSTTNLSTVSWTNNTDVTLSITNSANQTNPAILLAPSYVRREFTVTPAGSNSFYRVKATIAP